MNVGFYYHVPAAVSSGGSVLVPSHLGIVIESIARNAGSVTLYAHAAEHDDMLDHRLSPPLVRTVDLGPRRSFPSRTLRPGTALRRFRPGEQEVDCLLIQGPTPLLPHLVNRAGRVPTALLIWGDYRARRRPGGAPAWRELLIRLWIGLYSVQQQRAARGRLAFLQNAELRATVKRANVRVLPISSVSERSLPDVNPARHAWPASKGRDDPVRLVYSGRIVREKGLFEAVDAVKLLADCGYTAILELVGWCDPGDPTLDQLEDAATAHGIRDRVVFRGYFPAGSALMAAYSEADVFVLPSYWEGFPRALQEAMAVGLPAIAARVGGIPTYLRDGETGLLIEPHDSRGLADAVVRMIEEPELRKRVAEAGARWARSYTVESSCAELVRALEEWVGLRRDAPRKR